MGDSRLRELRLSQGWSLRDVSERTGMSQSAICLYEKGKRALKSPKVKALAKLYGVSTDYLYQISDIDTQEDDYRKIRAKMLERPEIYDLYLMAVESSEKDVQTIIRIFEVLKDAG